MYFSSARKERNWEPNGWEVQLLKQQSILPTTVLCFVAVSTWLDLPNTGFTLKTEMVFSRVKKSKKCFYLQNVIPLAWCKLHG